MPAVSYERQVILRSMRVCTVLRGAFIVCMRKYNKSILYDRQYRNGNSKGQTFGCCRITYTYTRVEQNDALQILHPKYKNIIRRVVKALQKPFLSKLLSYTFGLTRTDNLLYYRRFRFISILSPQSEVNAFIQSATGSLVRSVIRYSTVVVVGYSVACCYYYSTLFLLRCF